MTVTMRVAMAGADVCLRPGQQIELEEATARAWIEAEMASETAAESETTSQSISAETATAKAKGTRTKAGQ